MSCDSLQIEPQTVPSEAKLEFLLTAQAYPHVTGEVELIETHMSWVFLTDTHAYKMKKPVRYPYLDFGTLEARRRDCATEVDLNRRFAPDVYQGVVSLVRDSTGSLRLGGEGEVVEWLVKMRRLPGERMLDRLLLRHTLRPSELRALANTLASFYAQAGPIRLRPAKHLTRWHADVMQNRQTLVDPVYGLPTAVAERVCAAHLSYTKESARVLSHRVLLRKLIEAHGDLRPEHICLESPPVIIDGLQFNREFRILDPLDELSFLAMECDRLGAPWVGQLLLEHYMRTTGDRPPETLIAFYKSYRACLRARLAAWHLKERIDDARVKWIRKAREYLKLGASYILH